ncbi:hypothetical protein, partial [Psychrobacter proteolyticus]
MEVLDNNHIFWVQVFKDIKYFPIIEPKLACKEIIALDIDIPFNLTDDEVDSIYSELKRDFSWLESFYYKIEQGLKNSLTYDEVFELKGLCNWIFSQLNIWKIDSDPSFKKVSLCFLIIN